jgi:ABC-type dipeptide/oligopeptide/nickel transport system permease component
MLEIINEDYVRTARSKGLKEYTVVLKHAFRNALISVVTLLGLRIPWLFGGAVITETVFAWPGMGRLLVDSIMKRDYPVVQGVVLVIAILVVISNIIVDFAYAFLDPRIRYN